MTSLSVTRFFNSGIPDNKKGKYDLPNLEIITECVCKFPYKKQRISE